MMPSMRMKTMMSVALLAMVMMSSLPGCASKASPIPSQYREQIDQTVTFGMLSRQSENYRGKVVALGGVIVNARNDSRGRTWMFVRNRPLDIDLEPHIPVSRDEQDAFWAIVDPKQLSMNFKIWARITVIGSVSDESPSELGLEWKKGKQPIISALYLHGWEGFGSYSPAFKNATDDAKGSRGQFGSPSNLKKN